MVVILEILSSSVVKTQRECCFHCIDLKSGCFLHSALSCVFCFFFFFYLNVPCHGGSQHFQNKIIWRSLNCCFLISLFLIIGHWKWYQKNKTGEQVMWDSVKSFIFSIRRPDSSCGFSTNWLNSLADSVNQGESFDISKLSFPHL